MTAGDADTVRGRVLRTVGGVYHVHAGHETLECSLRGRLKREGEFGKVAVGDEVEVELIQGGGCAINAVLPRGNKLSRRSADGRREQIIAANVDQLAAVFSVARPEPDYELLDRFLLLAESNELPAFLVVNKLDLSSLESAGEDFGVYEAAGYEVAYTSATQGTGIDSLRERLADHITLFVGPSGVGKSSLLNAVQPGLGLRVGEVSRALQAGRHTTVAASLHPLDVGGYVVDTPGLRQLRFWEVEHRDLGWCFPEFRAHLGACRFSDCAHVKEPGCAVRRAVDAESIALSRYKSYLAICQESEAQRSY